MLQRSPGHHHGVVFAQRGRRAHQLQATRPAKRLHCIAQRGVASHAAADHQAARRCGGCPRRPSRWLAPIQRALQPIHDVAHGRQLKCRGEVLAGRGAYPGSQPPAVAVAGAQTTAACQCLECTEPDKLLGPARCCGFSHRATACTAPHPPTKVAHSPSSASVRRSTAVLSPAKLKSQTAR
eukprot:COSAG01_NODE_6585_length_3592_cov_3.100487_2_plen_181_part_00